MERLAHAEPPTHHLWAHSPTLQYKNRCFKSSHKVLESVGRWPPRGSDLQRGGGLSIGRLGRVLSPRCLACLQRGAGPNFRQRPPVRLGAISPPRLLGTAVLPAVPGLASHSTPMPAPLSTSFSLRRELKQQPKCRLMLQLSVVASSSTTWP